MGTEHSTRSSDVPDELETHQVKMERIPEEQPAQKTSSDTGNEMVKACCDEGSASPIILLPGGEANSFSRAAVETGLQVLEEDSQEGCNLLALSQNFSSDKGQPTGQTCELDSTSLPVEDNMEKPECIPPQIPSEAAEQLEMGTRGILLQGKGQSRNAELQKTAGKPHSLVDSVVQMRPTEISTPMEKEQDSEKWTAAQRESDSTSFEMIAGVPPGLALSEMAGGHCNRKTVLGPEQPEAQGFSAAECFRVEVAPLPVTEAQAGQNEGCFALDQVAAGTPKGAEGESTLAPKTLAVHQEKPPASDEVEHAAAMSGDAVQNDGAPPTMETMCMVEEHPTTAAIPDPEDEPIIDPPTESSPKVFQELAEAKKPSLMKEPEGAHSSPEAIEMVEAQAAPSDKCPQTGAEAKLSPVAQEAPPVGATDVDALARGLSGAPKESMGSLMRKRKPDGKFPKTFYFCCSQCNAGESEINADLVE